MKKRILIAVVGPTAIGKTALSIHIAKYYNTEIISADSRQFYKEMTIGTAVPTMKELKTVPHHFIQHKSIFDIYSVGDFERDAIKKLNTLFSNHEIVVMVGGSGLYVNAVTKGLDELPNVDPEIRKALNNLFEKEGIATLQDQLGQLDPIYFGKVDVENPHRLIRALEICIGTGRPYSSFLGKKTIKRPFRTVTVGLNANRDIIYDRINQRVDLMIKEGLMEEARKVYSHKDLNALQTVGYKELFRYFDGEWSLEFAISEIKKNTRRFAKRQLTWYRKNEHIIWFNHDDDPVPILKHLDKKLT